MHTMIAIKRTLNLFMGLFLWLNDNDYLKLDSGTAFGTKIRSESPLASALFRDDYTTATAKVSLGNSE